MATVHLFRLAIYARTHLGLRTRSTTESALRQVLVTSSSHKFYVRLFLLLVIANQIGSLDEYCMI